MQYTPQFLEKKEIFTPEQLNQMKSLSEEFSLDKLLENPRLFEDRTINYAYVSSKIEGSTYSRKGVSSLIKYGRTEGGKPLSDALMIKDLQVAFETICVKAKEEDVLTEDFISQIHSLVTRGNLPEKQRGMVRDFEVSVSGSSYQPLNSPQRLKTELRYMLDTARQISDPFDQAVYVHLNLAYLQFFGDGIKSTARLLQTAVMIHHGITPIFFTDEMIMDYLDAVVAYYEERNIEPYRHLFVRAYQHTIDTFLGRTSEQLNYPRINTRDSPRPVQNFSCCFLSV